MDSFLSLNADLPVVFFYLNLANKMLKKRSIWRPQNNGGVILIPL